MTFFDALVLGVVEGVTEFLPVSSTAHLMVAATWLGVMQSEFVKSFEITIQLGAIAAVVLLFWRKFLDTALLARIATAFIPTGIIGLLLYPLIKEQLIANLFVAIGALFVGGVFLIAFERWHLRRPQSEPRSLSYVEALIVGLCQAVAVIPGVSRSAATILGGLALGINRQTIVEFSFLLAAPTMFAATGYDLYQNAGSFAQSDFGVLGIGFASSFLVALAAARWLLRFIKTHDFTPFGLYRIAAAAVFFFLII